MEVGLARAAAAILGAGAYAGSARMWSIVSWLTMDDMLLCLRVSRASMTRSKPISLQMTGSGSMRGRQTISCASRPDRCVYPLHLFTKASAASPQLENRVVSLCEGKRGGHGDEGALVSRASPGTAARGRWRWVRERGRRPRNALLVESVERVAIVWFLFSLLLDNGQRRREMWGPPTIRGVLYFCCA